MRIDEYVLDWYYAWKSKPFKITERIKPMKFRKKPVIVEAYQTTEEMIIHTLEGDMKASVGDFIITGVNGEQYPCKPDIFEKTYEKIGETE